MERTCKICNRDFSRPYNLRQHYQRFHPSESQPKLLRMSRKDCFYGNERPKEECRSRSANGVSIGQYGGSTLESSDSSDDDADSMTNNVGSESEPESESESDVDSDEDDSNWVFDSIFERAEDNL